MNNKLNLVIVSFLCLLAVSTFSLQFHMEEKLSRTEEGTFNEDYLFAGDTLDFNGTAETLYFAGSELNLRGTVTGSLVAFAGKIHLAGSVGNDLILASGKTTIDGSVKGTIFIATGDLTVSEDALINGDMFIGSGSVRLNGAIKGDLRMGSGVVNIGTTIDGDVYLGAGEIVFGENGRINGNLTYTSDKPLSEAEQAKVSGLVSYKDDYFWNEKNAKEVLAGLGVAKIVFKIIGYLSLLALGFLILLLPFCHNFNLVESHKHFWSYALWGLIPFFLYPVATLILFVLVLTIPLGFALLLVAFPLNLITLVLGMTLSGQYLFTLLRWGKKHRFLYFLTGLACFIILSLIPYARILGFLLFSSLGWGIIIIQLYKYHLSHKQEA